MDMETLRRQYGAPLLELARQKRLEDVRIFGSTARGDAGEKSDVDMLVHPAPGCTLLDLAAFEQEASQLMGGRKVDVISDRAIKEAIAPFILAEAVRL